MKQWVLIVGQSDIVYGPFDTEKEAMEYARSIGYSHWFTTRVLVTPHT